MEYHWCLVCMINVSTDDNMSKFENNNKDKNSSIHHQKNDHHLIIVPNSSNSNKDNNSGNNKNSIRDVPCFIHQQKQYYPSVLQQKMDPINDVNIQNNNNTSNNNATNDKNNTNDEEKIPNNTGEWNLWNVFHRGVKQLKKKKKRKNSWDSIKDSEFDDLDAPNVHFRPEALETLCQLTKFSKKELKMIYRGFKQEAPSGVVREDGFKHIYSQFFPKGADVNQYAHYVFNTFDPEKTGIVTFTDFVIGLSVLSRGTVQDKLKWIFSLYDVNCDGIISKDDLSRIIISVYDLLGKSVHPQVDETTYKHHIDRVFKKLDLNNDGMITYEVFMEACEKDEILLQSFDVFNT